MAGDKERIDKLLVDLGLAPTREKAAALILEGLVFVDGRRVDKAGTRIPRESSIEIAGTLPYVSRGGKKLEAALDGFGIDVRDKVALDSGASTGGFTDCLLQRGARRVYSVDVGYGQLDWRLRRDPRVVNLERTHLLRFDWDRDDIRREPVEVVTLDLSFISLAKILPEIYPHLLPGVTVVALIKPQFEAGKGQVGKGGVVRDPEVHREVVARTTALAEGLGFRCLGVIASPLVGPKGNVEFLIGLVKNPVPPSTGSG